KFLGLLEEDDLGLLVAKAIGLAVKLRIYVAVGRDILAESKPHHTFVVELAGGRRCGERGSAEQQGRRCETSPDCCHCSFGLLPAPAPTSMGVSLRPTARPFARY